MGIYWDKCPEMPYPDIFFTAEYQDLFQDTAFGGEPYQFTCAGIDYRFYKRPIEGTPYFDIVSPYGYSGPIEIENANWDAFLEAFSEYCEGCNIIAEFARLNPFQNQQLHWQSLNGNRINVAYDRLTCGKPYVYEHEIYYIDLTQSEKEIWKGFDKGCKSAIKKNVELACPTQFKRLYERTMDRLCADKAYYFTPRFWDRLDKMSLTITVPGAIAVLLLKKPYAHYFLSANEFDGNVNRLIWEAILTCKSAGYEIYNIGGGLKPGDSLEHFKKSFTKLCKPFFTYRKVHNQAIYDKLSQGLETDYFPAYRSKK